jgi:RsmE family RNA methyltransferase
MPSSLKELGRRPAVRKYSAPQVCALYWRAVNIVLFAEDEIASPLPLADPRARHIVQVLHKREGDAFDAGVVGGKAGKAVITGIRREDGAAPRGTLSFAFAPESDGKPLHSLGMIIGFPRPIQLRRLLRDMASLGIAEIRLAGTDLGEKSYLRSALAERGTAHSLLLDGSAQAKSTHVPALSVHGSLDECLRSLPKDGAFRAGLDNARPEEPLRDFLLAARLVSGGTGGWAAVGSERGWTERERGALIEAGFTLCGLGERVLRTETAATAAAALILDAMGCLS